MQVKYCQDNSSLSSNALVILLMVAPLRAKTGLIVIEWATLSQPLLALLHCKFEKISTLIQQECFHTLFTSLLASLADKSEIQQWPFQLLAPYDHMSARTKGKFPIWKPVERGPLRGPALLGENGILRFEPTTRITQRV